MKRLAQFIRKYSKLIIIFTILLTILSATQIRNLVVDDDITEYLSEGDPEIEFYEEISEKFGRDDANITLISLEYNDLFELGNLQNFKVIAEQLEKSDYITSVNSFLNMPEIIATDFGIEVREFVEVFPETEQEARQLEQDAFEDELIRGAYLSPDGQAGLLMVESIDDIDGGLLKNEIENIVNNNLNNTINIEYHGLPIMDAQITEMATDNMSLVITAAIIVPITEFGVFATIGIFVAFLLVIFLLGAILNIFPPKKVPENFSYHADDLISRSLKFIAQSITQKKL